MNLFIPDKIRVLMPNGTVKTVELEEYVAGVVAATMPVDAPPDALMAQGVAARTFGAITRRHLDRGAEVCAQRHCQSWQAIPSLAARQAARETAGFVAVYGGKLIDAYYFDHCDGTTRDAAGVLLHAPAYLKSVDCACGFATLKGHGIGMCQRGALVMARFGERYDAILKHYYTGIELLRAEPGKASAPRPLPKAPEEMPAVGDAATAVDAQPPAPATTPSSATRTEETRTPVERQHLGLDEIEETAWYPVGDEPRNAAAAIENEMLDQAATGEMTLTAGTGALPIWEDVKPAEVAPPPDSLPEELPLVVPPPEDFLPSPASDQEVVATGVPVGPTIMVDSLPGPRIIAGDLTRAGLVVTICDLEGNAVVTVSGTAPHHGPGGFEAPLPEPGAYDVSFDHEGIRVQLQDETVFITYSA